MGLSSGTCERRTAGQNSASQQPDLSKEWMFQGNVAFQNVSEVDWDHVNDPVPDEVCKGFQEAGEQLKALFSEKLPVEIEYIVIIRYIAQISCDVHQNEKSYDTWAYLYVDMLLHRDVTRYSKGVGGFDFVVQYRARTSHLDKDLGRNPLLGGADSARDPRFSGGAITLQSEHKSI
jgi:hypothetical protein